MLVTVVNKQLMMDAIEALEPVTSAVRSGLGSTSSRQVVGVRQCLILFLTIIKTAGSDPCLKAL